MSQPLHRLKKAKAFLVRSSVESDKIYPEPTKPKTPEKVRQILRIFLKSPWDDYSYVRALGQSMLARHNLSFELVNLQEIPSSTVFSETPTIPRIQHPNIAAIYDIYSYDNNTYLATEYVHVPFTQLKIQEYELEEREIATIIAEVVKGVTFMSSLKLSCKDLSYKDIRLSLDGEVKLVLNTQNIKHNNLYESPKISQALLDFPILAEAMEEMIFSRYHLTSENQRWSKEALDFLLCTVEQSFENLHSFLKQAVSPKRLIPRIRFAYEALIESSGFSAEKEQSVDFNFVTSIST